jgi:hypothetical protein
MAIVAVRKVAQLLASIQPSVRDLIGSDAPANADPFSGVSSAAGPLLGSVVLVGALSGVDYLRSANLAFVILSIMTFLWLIPVWTCLWAVGTILFGLDRLGRMDLKLKPFMLDRSLGLRPLGRLAFQVFAILVALILPPMVLSTVEVRTMVTLFAILVAAVALFFLSLFRLHRRLQAEKRAHLDACRRQIAETLRDRGDAAGRLWDLHAAEATERRALAIQEWPFDEAAFVRVIAIATSVGTVILSRLVLLRMGL